MPLQGVESQSIANGAITTEKLADDAVTGAKIQDGAITTDDVTTDILESGIAYSIVFGG